MFDGRIVPIDVGLATRKGSAFLRVSRLKGDKRFVGWSPSRLPARVAFRSRTSITPEDSAAFWSILNQMETEIGMHLFEPASLVPGADPEDVIVVDTQLMSFDDGRTYLTWSSSGGIYDARVYFSSPATLHSPHVVTHEMMHALGFGHTTAWSSVMNPRSGSAPGLTLQDVAYAQFAFESRAATDRSDMWERLALANEREPGAERSRVEYPCRTSPFSVLSALSECAGEPQFGGVIGASGTSH